MFEIPSILAKQVIRFPLGADLLTLHYDELVQLANDLRSHYLETDNRTGVGVIVAERGNLVCTFHMELSFELRDVAYLQITNVVTKEFKFEEKWNVNIDSESDENPESVIRLLLDSRIIAEQLMRGLPAPAQISSPARPMPDQYGYW